MSDIDRATDNPFPPAKLYYRQWIDSDKLFDVRPRGATKSLSATKFVQQTVWDYFIGKDYTKIQVAVLWAT